MSAPSWADERLDDLIRSGDLVTHPRAWITRQQARAALGGIPPRAVVAAFDARATPAKREGVRGWTGLGHVPVSQDRDRAVRAAHALAREFGGRWLSHGEAHEWADALRFQQRRVFRGQVWADLAAGHPAAVQRTARRIRFAPASDDCWHGLVSADA